MSTKISKSIVLACYEVPGYGGASTATYQLFQLLRREELDVDFVNFIDGQDVDFFRYVYGASFGNPDHLSHVHNQILDEPLYGPQSGLTDFIDEKSPDLMIGVDSIASLLLKKAAPQRTMVFMTSGCQTVQDLIFRSGQDFLSQKKVFGGMVNPKLNLRELEAVGLADLIITHSEITRAAYETFYPSYSGKLLSQVIWKAEWIYEEAKAYLHLRKPFSERDIDVLFLASSWTRPEKNYALVQGIAGRSNFGTHILGEVHNELPTATHHGLVMDRGRVFELMGRARTVACPSIFDAAPGILFEASAMGCNIVASKNCGNWQLCHDDLLVDPLTPDRFVAAIELSIERKFEDHMDFFLKAGSFQNLLETIAVV